DPVAVPAPPDAPPPAGRAEPMARNAFFKAGSQATRLLSMGFLIVAARILGPEGFGKFTVAYALATLLGAALDLAVPATLTRRGGRLVGQGVLVVAGLGGLWVGGGLAAVCGAFVLAALVSLTVSVGVLHRSCARFARAWHPGRARALAREVGLVSAWFVVAFAATRLVPLVVAWLSGERAAGYLGAAVRVVDALQVLPVVVTAAVYPVLARLVPTDPRFRELAR